MSDKGVMSEVRKAKKKKNVVKEKENEKEGEKVVIHNHFGEHIFK